MNTSLIDYAFSGNWPKDSANGYGQPEPEWFFPAAGRGHRHLHTWMYADGISAYPKAFEWRSCIESEGF